MVHERRFVTAVVAYLFTSTDLRMSRREMVAMARLPHDTARHHCIIIQDDSVLLCGLTSPHDRAHNGDSIRELGAVVHAITETFDATAVERYALFVSSGIPTIGVSTRRIKDKSGNPMQHVPNGTTPSTLFTNQAD